MEWDWIGYKKEGNGVIMNEAKTYKVSVVTAVYNVEDYLEEMVESIIAQTIGFENIQLILVDDGSEDNSWAICERYMAKYPNNVVAIHKENGGVSSARNEGLKHVRGEFVNFTDSDDMLEEDALEKMYDFLKKNEQWIDVAAIKMVFFGGREGEHALNYKFKKSRVVELRKDYMHVQLSMSSTLIKSSCFEKRKFDESLSYAEDAKVLLDIFLDKMRYGVVSDTAYLYRKRVEGTSAIDRGRERPAYYIPYMERFNVYSLENALKRKGYIPKFIQYTCMNDLQWRLKYKELVEEGVLTQEEVTRYKELLLKALSYIDDAIINEQRYINGGLKAALTLLKEQNRGRKEIVPYTQDVKICIGDTAYTAAAFYKAYYEFITISQQEIILEGNVRYAVELGDVEIFLKGKGSDGKSIKYKTEVFDREERRGYCMDELITVAKGFRCVVDRKKMPNDMQFEIFLCYQGQEISWKNIGFLKFFPLTELMESSYLYHDGILLTYSDNKLVLKKTRNMVRVKACEKKFLEEMHAPRDGLKISREDIAFRKSYFRQKKSKKKEIWLISDRVGKADDNGEAFFTYMNTVQKNSGIETYFVLDKDSEDYERLSKIGKVVPFLSAEHKRLFLLCDKIISSQGEDYVFHPFFAQSYLYRDIMYTHKYVFLQHGVTQNDLSGWLRKVNKNISMFVTTTNMEHQSILDYDYGYDETQVKRVGFPRFDYLHDNSKEKRIITFMPTWRAYLVGSYDAKSDKRVLEAGFEDSNYCQMYREVFSDHRLYEMAEKYGYQIQIMPHPAMPEKCFSYFNCGDAVKILDKKTRYRDLFADSSLIVTDYSSAVFDFAYLYKPVLYYQKDAEEFFSGKHTIEKGYFEHEKHGFGEVEYTAESLVERIIEYMERDCQLKDVYRDRIDKTFAYHDKENCRRTYEEIRKL